MACVKLVSMASTNREAAHLRWTSYCDSHTRQDRVALAVAKRVVHRRREQREAEARTRAQERHRRERRGGVQRERVDDVRLDRLEVEDDARTDERDALIDV